MYKFLLLSKNNQTKPKNNTKKRNTHGAREKERGSSASPWLGWGSRGALPRTRRAAGSELRGRDHQGTQPISASFKKHHVHLTGGRGYSPPQTHNPSTCPGASCGPAATPRLHGKDEVPADLRQLLGPCAGHGHPRRLGCRTKHNLT